MVRYFMKKFEIWNEGYACNSERGGAQYLGTYEGHTFKDATKAALVDKKWDMSYYDEEQNTYWACGFFDNETSARASFG